MTAKSKKIRNLVLIAVALVVVLGGVYFKRSQNAAREAEANAYRESIIERGDVLISIRATGTVKPENRLEIKPPIAGRVETVLIREGDHVRKSQILAWMSSSERAAVLDAARAKGAEEVARWEELYRATPILSPINGTVILRSVEPGQTFSSTDSVFVLSDRLTVRAQVDETDLAQVKVGMKASVILDAYQNERVPAKVARIAYEATAVNNVTMYEVDVTPEKTPETMRSGMTATVRFDVASKEDVVIVPNDAVRTEGSESFVLLKQGDKQGAQRVRTPVKLGLSDGKVSEVLSGLTEGDIVVARVLGEASASERASNPFMPTPPRGARGGGRSSGGGGSARP